MKPSIWGPYVWTSVHMIALGYPEKPSDTDKLNYKTFFSSLGNVVPCTTCSKNYTRHFLELPIDTFLESKKSLFTWTVKLHNIVNIETGKPIWSIDQAWDYYVRVAKGEIIPLLNIDEKNRDYLISQTLLFISILLIINASFCIFFFRNIK